MATKTIGQSNLTQGRIAVAHGQFSRIRQVAPMCTPMVPWIHPTRHPKLHLDQYSRFAGLTIVTDRQTDRQTDLATPSVTIGLGRTYVVRRCDLIMTMELLS